MSDRLLVDSLEVELDRTRRLKFSMNTVTIFKQKIGKSLIKFMAEGEAADFSELETQALLLAGLIHEDKFLTMERVGDLMEKAPGDGLGEKLHYLNTKCLQAYTLWAGTQEMKKKVREQLLDGISPTGRISTLSSSNVSPTVSSDSPQSNSAS